MATPEQLLAYNHEWAEQLGREQPELLERMAAGQAPEYLWLGCADSRVPPNWALGLGPGELFVHRNVGNLADPGDPAVRATVAFAVGVLKVGHIIVAGHTDCGATKAALTDSADTGSIPGDVSHWLKPLRGVAERYAAELKETPADERPNLLARRNVAEQVQALAAMPPVTEAWANGQALTLHGWLYRVHDAHLEDLGIAVSGPR
jgi:carbonic anhydrase